MTGGIVALVSETGVQHPSAGADRIRPRHRPAWIVLVVLGAVICMGMAYWQLTRFQSASGNAQNLGYTFMWPFLGLFLIYAYLRYIRLEAEQKALTRAGGSTTSTGDGVREGAAAHDDDNEDEDDDRDEGANGGHSGATGHPGRSGSAPATRRRRASSASRRTGGATEIPADLLPARPTVDPGAAGDSTLRAYNDHLAELARQDAARARTGRPQEKHQR